jgi:hypothetical protein
MSDDLRRGTTAGLFQPAVFASISRSPLVSMSPTFVSLRPVPACPDKEGRCIRIAVSASSSIYLSIPQCKGRQISFLLPTLIDLDSFQLCLSTCRSLSCDLSKIQGSNRDLHQHPSVGRSVIAQVPRFSHMAVC